MIYPTDRGVVEAQVVVILVSDATATAIDLGSCLEVSPNLDSRHVRVRDQSGVRHSSDRLGLTELHRLRRANDTSREVQDQ